MRVPLIVAIILILVSVLTDLYIFLDLRKNFPARKWAHIFYAASSIMLWIVLGITIAMPKRDANWDISIQMWLFYSYLTILVPKIIFILFSAIGQIPRIFKGRGIKLGLWVGLPIGIITFISMWWGAAVTRHQIEVTHTDVYSERLPKGFENYRIVQISDLHVGTWGEDTRFISRLVDSVNAQNPDVIFFTGDIVNRETSEVTPFLKALAGLRAKDGVFSILGNHDYGDYMTWNSQEEKRENLQLLKNWQRQIGWKLLNNEATQLTLNGDTIQLIGVENWGEPPFHQYGHLTDAYPINPTQKYHLNDSRFKILLTHNPEHWRREVTKISNIDLSLSGHTHAMQIVFSLGNRRWSPSAWKYEEWGGLYQKMNPQGEPLQIYVNIGAGEVGMPFRIGATPEVSVITLKKGTPSNN